MTVKEQLYTACLSYIKDRIKNAEALVASAREAAESDTKSSAGDKYETGREMMQQEIDLNLGRIAEAKTQLRVLEQVDIEKNNTSAIPGSLVYTNLGNYFIAIGAGKITVAGNTYMAISITSPIGAAMRGLKTGDNIRFNNRDHIIENIT